MLRPCKPNTTGFRRTELEWIRSKWNRIAPISCKRSLNYPFILFNEIHYNFFHFEKSKRIFQWHVELIANSLLLFLYLNSIADSMTVSLRFCSIGVLKIHLGITMCILRMTHGLMKHCLKFKQVRVKFSVPKTKAGFALMHFALR